MSRIQGKILNLHWESIVVQGHIAFHVMKHILNHLVMVCADMIGDWPWPYHVIAGHTDESRVHPRAVRLRILKSFKMSLSIKHESKYKNISLSFPPPSAPTILMFHSFLPVFYFISLWNLLEINFCTPPTRLLYLLWSFSWGQKYVKFISILRLDVNYKFIKTDRNYRVSILLGAIRLCSVCGWLVE